MMISYLNEELRLWSCSHMWLSGNRFCNSTSPSPSAACCRRVCGIFPGPAVRTLKLSWESVQHFGSSLKRPGVVFLHDFLHLSYLALNFTLEAKFEKPHVINKLMKWLFQPTYLWGFYLHLLPRTWPVTARPHTPIHAVSSFTSFSSPSLTCVIQK